MSALRRYEILLPSQFNDGRPIPPDLIADTLQESTTSGKAGGLGEV